MRIRIRRITMTEISIDFGGEHETGLRFRNITPERLLSGQFAIGATSFVAILFLIGFLLVGIGTVLTTLSKVLAVALSILFLIAASIWGIKWVSRQIDILIEWWFHLWGYKVSQRKLTLASTQRHRSYQKHHFLV